MSVFEFILLAAKGAVLGLAVILPLFAAVILLIRRHEHVESGKKSAQMRAWLSWHSGAPDPQTYFDEPNGKSWDRQYYHDLAQYTRRAGNEPGLK